MKKLLTSKSEAVESRSDGNLEIKPGKCDCRGREAQPEVQWPVYVAELLRSYSVVPLGEASGG